MAIEATAPSRIDLAGGTLDIFPLYLFEEGGLTLNLAISVHSHVRLHTREDQQLCITSHCTGDSVQAPSVDELDVYTRNDAPHGSGLGASSSLLIALSGGLRSLNGANTSDMDLARYGADLEAQAIRIPTGKQDYYSAIFGGLNAIWFDVGGDRVESLSHNDELLDQLEQRLLLFFTGEARFSGATNWDMLKMYIDRVGTAPESMKAIKRTALAMREAFINADLDAFAELLNEEWENRKRRAEGVSTDRIEELMAAAKANGALASRVCGAGGGGCISVFCKSGVQQSVISALEEMGAEHIPYTVDREGLRVLQS
jgi:D-glycero-alpha-D-manno-heptose-7-phosphate kinase